MKKKKTKGQQPMGLSAPMSVMLFDGDMAFIEKCAKYRGQSKGALIRAFVRAGIKRIEGKDG